jgi:tetratricopeptide (TPR) repeat protein
MPATSFRTTVTTAWLLTAWSVSAAISLAADPGGDDRALARSYGAGVHAYFANDYQRAYDDLTLVIEAGSNDPRAWYFRGLAAAKLGRLDEAEADFATGADREAAAAGDWPVSRSLERVQGHDRLALERQRIRARVAELQQRERAIADRYSRIEARQDGVRRRIRPEGVSSDPLGLFTQPADPAAPANGGDRQPPERIPAPETDPIGEPAVEPEAERVPVEDSPEEPAGEEEMEADPPAEGELPAEAEPQAEADLTAEAELPAEVEPEGDADLPAPGFDAGGDEVFDE